MNQIYKNNQEIVEFFTKAQNKIAELTVLVADELVDEVAERLLLDLSDFLEILDSFYCTYKVVDVIRYIHYFNKRANLYSIPLLQITNYQVNIITGTPSQLGDITSLIQDEIRKVPHNSLSSLQGGSITERYHITKEMHDWITCQMSKNSCTSFVDSSINLTLNTSLKLWPSGYYELGQTASVINLLGSINYGSLQKADYFSYLKESVQLGKQNNPFANSQPNSYADTTPVKSDTNYSFVVSFSGVEKKITKSMLFKQPLYYGAIKRSDSSNISLLINKTKDVVDKQSLSYSFNIPTGNTLLPYNDSLTPFLFIPFEWGRFNNAYVGIFDFANDWSSQSVLMPLADGSTKAGLLLTYNTQIEGSTTFKFNW